MFPSSLPVSLTLFFARSSPLYSGPFLLVHVLFLTSFPSVFSSPLSLPFKLFFARSVPFHSISFLLSFKLLFVIFLRTLSRSLSRHSWLALCLLILALALSLSLSLSLSFPSFLILWALSSLLLFWSWIRVIIFCWHSYKLSNIAPLVQSKLQNTH